MKYLMRAATSLNLLMMEVESIIPAIRQIKSALIMLYTDTLIQTEMY